MAQPLPRQLKITRYDNAEFIASSLPYHYEDPDRRELRQLRERYRLDDVIAKAKTEFGQMVALRNWVQGRWAHGGNFKDHKPYIPAHNALTILAAAEQGVRFHCAYFATVYIQCLLSLGWQARRLFVRSKFEGIPIPSLPGHGHIGHRISEVWSNQYRKWILMDADLNVHYKHGGVPLCAFEIRSLCLAGKTERINIIQGKPLPPQITSPHLYTPAELRDFKALSWNHKILSRYYHVLIETQNNWMSNPAGTPLMAWSDAASPPMLYMGAASAGTQKHVWTQNPNDINWTLNQAHIRLDCAGGIEARPSSRLDVTLTHNMPHFDKFLVQIDAGKWRKRPDSFAWRLHAGENTIRVEPVNRYEREGIESVIGVRLRR